MKVYPLSHFCSQSPLFVVIQNLLWKRMYLIHFLIITPLALLFSSKLSVPYDDQAAQLSDFAYFLVFFQILQMDSDYSFEHFLNYELYYDELFSHALIFLHSK